MSERKSENPLKIGICMHAYKCVDFDVCFNLAFAVSEWVKNYKLDLVFVGKRGLDAADARNKIIEQCFNSGCTHAFFIDEDHFMSSQSLPLLLETGINEAIVSGLVCKKGEGFNQVCWDVKGDGDKREYFQLTLPIDGRVYQVGVCAFGCTLINLEKLKKLKKPYFRDTCVESSDGNLHNVRSDVNLCLAFNDIGERCWVDTRVLVGHQLSKPSAVYPQSADLFCKLKDIERSITALREGQTGAYYVSESEC